MPSPRINQDPPKVYFSASEVCLMLDCSKDWLWLWTRELGFKTRNEGRHHRYSAKEINILTVIRKTNLEHNQSKGFDYTAYLREYMRKQREQGKYKYVRKNA